MTVIHGKFEWNSDKAEDNIRKHGVAFEEILPMFDDPLFWEQLDVAHSTADETRYFGTAKINVRLAKSIIKKLSDGRH